MALRAKKHEAIEKRLKMFLYGDPGAGKTTAAISFPNSYVIDCERGCDHYAGLLAKSGSVLFQSVDADEAIEEVRSLATEKHDYRTVIIDPITTMEADLIEKAEKEYGAGDMRIWGKRDRTMRRLVNLLMSLDMNVIITAHGKTEYGEKMTKLGKTHDGWRRLPYTFDLSIELEKRGEKRVGTIKKTRLEGFKDGESIDFSYEEIARRYGAQIVERAAVPVAIATPEEIARLKQLIETVKLEDGWIEKRLAKAGVDTIEDLPSEIVRKCNEYIEAKFQGKEEKTT